MLARVRCLFESDRGLSFYYEDVKILGEQNENRFGHCADDARLDVVHHIKNSERAILKNRVGI
jgi:hypothetical protein